MNNPFIQFPASSLESFENKERKKINSLARIIIRKEKEKIKCKELHIVGDEMIMIN